MKRMGKACGVLILAAIVVGASGEARALTANYTVLADYLADTGPQIVIDFTEVITGTTVTTQYIGLGVEFADGNDVTLPGSGFLSDGIGLDAAGTIELVFSSPITSLGFDFPGAINIEIFDDTVSVGMSTDFGGSGIGFFGGITSTVAFNRAIITDWFDDSAFVDNMYFGQVPEPNTATLLGLGLAGIAAGRRRTLAHAE